MSNIVSAIAQRKVVGSHVKKSVLMYMADKASDDGSGIWTSKANMAADLETTDRTVRRAIREMVRDGIILEVGHKPCRSGFTVNYSIDLDVLMALSSTRNTPDTLSPPDTVSPLPLTLCHPPPDTVSGKPPLEPPLEPTHPIGCDTGKPASWEEACEILTRSGISQRQARAVIGKWNKENGQDEIMEKVGLARDSPDPVAYVAASLTPKNGNAMFKKITDEWLKEAEENDRQRSAGGNFKLDGNAGDTGSSKGECGSDEVGARPDRGSLNYRWRAE